MSNKKQSDSQRNSPQKMLAGRGEGLKHSPISQKLTAFMQGMYEQHKYLNELAEANNTQAVTVLALMEVLINKGLTTEVELEKLVEKNRKRLFGDEESTDEKSDE